MIIEIQHETRLTYSQPVAEWMAELRVEPMSDDHQSCQTVSLTVTGGPAVFRYTDGFGNRVHHFNLMTPPLELHALSASVVETHPVQHDWDGSKATWPIDPDHLPIQALDFTRFGGPVRSSPHLTPVVDAVRPAIGSRVVDLVLAVSQHIFSKFKYAKAVTHASSPIDDVLSTGQGVCQDFAHLMIGMLRSFGVPARYVSGYIHRQNKESQSHAWCEAWVPDLGWVGMDPTNNRPVNEHFVKVAVGRNFTDVPPNKGVYRGAGEETIRARVETRELVRQPTLSWQDQLPKLHVPLMVVLAHLQREPLVGLEAEEQQLLQQQQQQQ